MADLVPCYINAPHEVHPWIELDKNDQRKVLHHYCSGKQWNNNEVFNHLQNLIREALKKPRYLESGGLSHDDQIMQEIWPEVVGFLQPEDMPARYILAGDDIAEREIIDQWNMGRGKIMLVPPTAEDRMADALEKIEKHLRPPSPEAYDPSGF